MLRGHETSDEVSLWVYFLINEDMILMMRSACKIGHMWSRPHIELIDTKLVFRRTDKVMYRDDQYESMTKFILIIMTTPDNVFSSAVITDCRIMT